MKPLTLFSKVLGYMGKTFYFVSSMTKKKVFAKVGPNG
jgi:YHS domain-containing protein